jgi:hypothetical protein
MIMRKHLIGCLVSLLAPAVLFAGGAPAPLDPHGAHKNTFQDGRTSVDGEDMEAAFDQLVVNAKRIVLPRILEDKPLRVKIDYDTNGADLDLLGVWVELAYNSWFQNALNHIYTSAKEDEQFVTGDVMILPLNGVARVVHKNTKEWFSDIIPILRRGVRVDVVPSSTEKADLQIRVFSHKKDLLAYCECKTCLACSLSGTSTQPPEIVLGRDWNEGILQHEIGHTFGLTDVYGTAYQQNSAKYYHSTANAESSIMQGSRLGHLTCDDADGLINVIDLVRHVKTRRIKEGWHSLCPVKDTTADVRDIYQYATPDGRRTHENLIASLEAI